MEAVDATRMQRVNSRTYLLDGQPPQAPRTGTMHRLSSLFESAIVCGPLLKFQGIESSLNGPRWRASILIVIPASLDRPQLKMTPSGSEESVYIAPEFLYIGEQQQVLRYPFRIKQLQETKAYAYSFFVDDRYVFNVPGVTTPLRAAFYSCNGFQTMEEEQEMEGIQPLWKDLRTKHAENPFHVLIGGGDQGYFDGVWALPELQEWLAIDNQDQRKQLPFNRKMEEAVTRFYFKTYCAHFHQPQFAEALASIPSVMIWDDHDIFDGWGSYPDYLQQSPVFQGVFAIARRFYLLFQQQMTETQSHETKVTRGLSYIHQLSATTAILMLDTRSERSKMQICSEDTYTRIFDRLSALPVTIKDLYVVLTVPIAYPEMAFVERALQQFQDVVSSEVSRLIFGKPKLFSKLMNVFGEIDLLDDVGDQWKSVHHQEERKWLLQRMHAFASSRGMRITILTGDVHAGGAGIIESTQNGNKMIEIISSPIGNKPSPKHIVKILRVAGSYPKQMDGFRELLLAFNRYDIHSRPKALFASRNWVCLEERPNDRIAVLFYKEKSRKEGEERKTKAYRLTILPIRLHQDAANPDWLRCCDGVCNFI